jgi:DNA-binding transcriptional ArsR family regulator
MIPEGPLTDQLRDLTARVERLERHHSGTNPPPVDPVLGQRLAAALAPGADGAPGEPAVVYAGAGAWGTSTLTWQIIRGWREVPDDAGAHSAEVFSALASPIRVRIVAELLGGEMTTAELTARLAQPSAGQLFHHLKELLAAGVVHQPVRGTYAIRKQRVVPLLALLSAATDINPPRPDGDET